MSTPATKDTLLSKVTSSSSNLTMTASTDSQPSDQDSVASTPKTTEISSDSPKISDDENGDGDSAAGDIAKRFLPAYKKANAALTFPEKMMNLMKYVEEKNKIEKEFCVSWLPEGKAFVIYNIKDFTSSVVPKFFKASKFCSFTRKLYRWGFRQLNRGIGPDEPIIFGNEYFQRDNADLMVNMRSITAASIRKRESDLLRHMLASKKRAMMSLDVSSNASYQDKHLNMLLNNTPFDQKQQNTSLASAANAMASQQRLGGAGFATDLGHLDNHSLQMMYQSLTNKSAGSGDGSIVPIINDAVSQMNNTSPYPNFSGSVSPHAQELNAMNHSVMMGGPTSNYMAHMNGQNGSETNVSNGGNGRMNNMNSARINMGNNGRMNNMNSARINMGNNGRINNMNANFNNNGYSGSLNNAMFPSDAMYANGSTNNRGNGGFNLPQQYNNGVSNGENANTRKIFINHGGKPNFHSNGANHEISNYNNVPMNMNINQHLFNLTATQATAGGSEETYFGGQY